MKVSEIGEFGLIDLLAKMMAGSPGRPPAGPRLTVGIGDDAAAWPGKGQTQLATIDSLIEDVHFSLDKISWKELGWKSLAVNLSDIAAMGGTPEYVLISLGLPDSTEVEDVTALYKGMIELAEQHHVSLAGGDTCRSPMVAITVSVFGTGQDNILHRSAAQPGDSIAVTGYLGSAAAGHDMLANDLRFTPEVAAYLREAFNQPKPRLAEGRLLVKQGIKTAIDISDGLLADLRHICKMSNVSAGINVDKIPIHPAVRDNFGQKAQELALAGGEDYELLFTGSDAAIGKVQMETSCPVTVIGEITTGNPSEINLFDSTRNPVHTNQSGWEHFIKQ
jgi:thiamine-monophosphate kinase